MMRTFKIQFVLMAIIYFAFVNGNKKQRDFFNAVVDQALEYNLIQSINTTADPCEDFYAYSCGNYNGYRDSSDESVQEITQYLDYKYNVKLIKLVTAIEHICDDDDNCFHFAKDCLDDTVKQTFREKVQTYYKACVSENSTNFVKYFEQLQIRWPLLLQPNETCAFGNKDFWQALGQLQGYKWNNVIIRHEIIADKNGTLNIILEPAAPNKFPNVNAIEGALKALKVDNASDIVLQLRGSEDKWLEIFQNNTNSSSSGDTYTELPLEDVARQYPYLSSYLHHLLNQKVNQIDKIILKNVEFFKYFHEIQWPAEEWQQQLNYLMLHFLFYLFEDSTSDFTANACVVDLRNKLDLAINYMYYYDQIGHQHYWIYKEALMRLNHQMKTVMQDLLDENKLNLTSQQINDLKNRLLNMKLNVGNLPYPVSNETIEKFYKAVPPLDNGNYFKNHLLLLQHRFLKSLLYQEDLNFYITADNSLASSSSLFYVAKQNLVVIPFANLQYPMYHYMFKPLYQVSLMGLLMAHEMAHAFDSNGLLTMDHSSILQHDLYMESLRCMQNQKPTEDIDERIADLLAERVAYQTYETFYSAVNNTNWQRDFYLNMAQFFCNKGDLEFLDHDADAVRLHQIVMNSEAFAQAFNCTLDSSMNPLPKCRLY